MSNQKPGKARRSRIDDNKGIYLHLKLLINNCQTLEVQRTVGYTWDSKPNGNHPTRKRLTNIPYGYYFFQHQKCPEPLLTPELGVKAVITMCVSTMIPSSARPQATRKREIRHRQHCSQGIFQAKSARPVGNRVHC